MTLGYLPGETKYPELDEILVRFAYSQKRVINVTSYVFGRARGIQFGLNNHPLSCFEFASSEGSDGSAQ